MKILFIICADMAPLLQKIDTCHNNPENSSTTKINKYTASSYFLLTHYSFDVIKNMHDYCKGKDCIKNYCKDLKEHVTKIISYEKKNDAIKS